MTGVAGDQHSAVQVAELPPFNTPEYFADPYTTLTRIRDVGPVLRIESPPHWFVTGYVPGEHVLRHPAALAEGFARRQRAIRSRYGDRFDPLIEVVRLQMVLMNAPDHPRVRRALQAVFTPRAIEDQRHSIREVVRRLLDDAGEDLDLIRDLASPLPAIVIATLLGVPEEDRPRFVRWSNELVAFVGTTRSDADHLATVQADMLAWGDYFGELASRERGGTTVLARLLALTESDQLSWPELVSNAIFLMAAGHETTTNLIGNGALALSRAPEQWSRLRADPGLLSGAVEEFLRFDPPVQFSWRIAGSAIELADVTIPAGDMINVSIGAANRDPARFIDPDRLDVARPNHDHLAFAQGAHYCLGAALARLEGYEAFAALIERFYRLQVSGPTEFRPNPTFRGLASLPLATIGAHSGDASDGTINND